MKHKDTKKVALVAALTGIAALVTGCGSANSTPSGVPAATNNIAGNGVAGCVPISQPVIGFQSAQSYVTWNTVLAGSIPNVDSIAPGRTIGTVTLTAGGGTGGPYKAPNSQLTYVRDGSISLNLTGVVPNTTGVMNTNVTTGPITGVITVSQQKLSEVMAIYGYSNYTTPGSYPYLTNGTTQPCVYGVGIALSKANEYNLYGGRVYLYVGTAANTQYPGQTMGSGRGYYLYF